MMSIKLKLIWSIFLRGSDVHAIINKWARGQFPTILLYLVYYIISNPFGGQDIMLALAVTAGFNEREKNINNNVEESWYEDN